MKHKKLLPIIILSLLLLSGCGNNNLTSENETLKQQITEMESHIVKLEEKITQLQQDSNVSGVTPLENTLPEQSTATNHSDNQNKNQLPDEKTYTMTELSSMVNDYINSVGSATPDINNSGNLEQYFALKKDGEQIEYALESYEDSLENQYRLGTITKDEFRKSDRELEKLEDDLDSALDRLEIAFEIVDPR